jgi:hypothetical protein
MNLYYKLDKDKNVVPGNMEECEKIYSNENNERIVKQEYVLDKFVSTVFLSIDHGFSFYHDTEYKPIVFETMVFPKSHIEIYCDRYSTWKEAIDGHEKAVEWVKNGCIEDE